MSRDPSAITQEIKALDLSQILDDQTGEDLAVERLQRQRRRFALEVEWLRTVENSIHDDAIIF